MKVVFPNSAIVSAREKFILRGGVLSKVKLSVRYGVVVHPDFGPILIDTGYTHHSVSGDDRSTMLKLYGAVLKPQLNQSKQPIEVLKDLGFTPDDVRFVIMTHFHADHVSGLKLFENVQFICSKSAWQKVRESASLTNIRHGIFTELLPDDFGERLYDLSTATEMMVPDLGTSALDIFGDESLGIVDLPGHAEGHFGVWIRADEPVLYAVDAHWLLKGLVQPTSAGLPARLIIDDYNAFQETNKQVNKFRKRGGRVILCHDPEPTAYDYEKLA